MKPVNKSILEKSAEYSKETEEYCNRSEEYSKYVVLPITFGVFFIGIAISTFYTITGKDVTVVKNCFDKYGNQIIGQICTSTTNAGREIAFVIVLFSFVCAMATLYYLWHKFEVKEKRLEARRKNGN